MVGTKKEKQTNRKGSTKKKQKGKESDDGNSKLYQTYYDPTHVASFGGKTRLQQYFPRATVEKWAPGQLPYSLHKPIRKKFTTRAYRVAGEDELWQMDLLEMIPYATINKGYRYILVCIDVFSRFARALPCKSKTGEEVAERIVEMFTEVSPRSVQTDKGKEFYNKHVQKVFDKLNINHYTVNSQFKAAIVERFNRTLREKLNRYFTHTGEKKWVDMLPTIISTYNKTKHRGIFNKTPESITPETEFKLWELQENETSRGRRNEKPLEVLSYVRISKISTSNPFNKNFDQNWSDEVFRIVGIDNRTKPDMYIIEDDSGNVIDGKFYKAELQVLPEKPKTYRIEKVLKSRGKGEHKQYFVKWHGYTNDHNSWIDASQLVNR